MIWVVFGHICWILYSNRIIDYFMFTSTTQVPLIMFTQVIVRFCIKRHCSISKESKIVSSLYIRVMKVLKKIWRLKICKPGRFGAGVWATLGSRETSTRTSIFYQFFFRNGVRQHQATSHCLPRKKSKTFITLLYTLRISGWKLVLPNELLSVIFYW